LEYQLPLVLPKGILEKCRYQGMKLAPSIRLRRFTVGVLVALFAFTLSAAGQAVTISSKKAHSAANPRAVVSQSCQDAMDALRSIRSVTESESGIAYRDYAPRVLDAKVKVDRCQNSTPGTIALRLVMREYELASRAWNAGLVTEFGGVDAMAEIGNTLDRNAEISKCPTVRNIIENVGQSQDHGEALALSWGAERAKLLAKMPWIVQRPVLIGLLVGQTPSILWACASAHLAEAEQLTQQ
jgi:hypothetical protein